MSKMICKCEDNSFSGTDRPAKTKQDILEDIQFFTDLSKRKSVSEFLRVYDKTAEQLISELKKELEKIDSLFGLNQSANKYRVIKGIFKEYVFNGHEVEISGQKRIWDDDSVGRSFPIENTEVFNG